MTQQSINIGRQHQNPIPNACRIGPVVMTSVLIGANPDTAELPPDLDGQCVNLFANIRQLCERAGGSPNDIIKLTVWLADLNDRVALNREWLAMYPDPNARPARHARKHIGNPAHLILCDFTMVIGV
jgi:enamine deaminase RidA (YjgF/YER057c/UK114 family)